MWTYLQLALAVTDVAAHGARGPQVPYLGATVEADARTLELVEPELVPDTLRLICL